MPVVSISGDNLIDEETGEVIRTLRSEDQQSIEGMESTVTGAPLEGTEEQLSFELDSQFNLSDSTLKIAAVPVMTVHGQYKEGDRIKVVLEIEIESIAFPPIKSRGFRIGTERRHTGQVLSSEPL